MDNESKIVYVVTWEDPDIQDFGVLAVFADEKQAGRLASEMNKNPGRLYEVRRIQYFS